MRMFDRARYEKEHNDIFDEYRTKYQDRNSYLFEDGIVDPDNYRGVLFLLKEAYSKEQKFGERNLVGTLAKEGPWGMWNRVCEWVNGIENTTENRVERFRKFSDEEKRGSLSHLAVINVKKINGTPTSDDSDLQKYVEENKDILRREVESIQPKLIVCGYTFRYLQTIFDIKTKRKSDNWYYWLTLDGLGTVLVLDYYHPAVQYPSLLTYYGITNIYQQALINKPE